MEIIIASHNVHKINEFRDMFKSLKNFDILSLSNFPHYQLPPETGKTFQENAIQKAESAAKSLNKWVLADDSGLVVPSLNDEPGIYSRRYAGDDATDADNRQLLLSKLTHLTGDRRAAYFECCLALASPEGLKKSVTGFCEGTILEQERGRYGFGYDSLFTKFDYDKTFAELDAATKNKISHRRKAFEKLLVILETLEDLA